MARRSREARHHGFLVIDKPAGWTSHDVVAKVRRLVGERRVGHAGTLDPAAVGVLPVAVGLATRTIGYLADASKSYLAEITFGVETDSADADGMVIATSADADLDEPAVSQTLQNFIGDQLQAPPMHSAIRMGGRRLYELARQGEAVDVEPRRVTFHRLELLGWASPVATVFVGCSKGTYVRALARDLGRELGTGAYLSNLIRLRTGPFTLCEAMTLDELEQSVGLVPWEQLAFHPDTILETLDAVVLDETRTRHWVQGKPVAIQAAEGTIRVYDAEGTWLGVGVADDADGVVRPHKVVLKG